MVAGVKLRLLLVDEDPADLALLLRQLCGVSDAWAEVTTAGSAGAALNEVGRRPFDALLFGCHLGSTTGFELFARVRTLFRDLPVILLTDEGSESLAVDCLQVGMADYIPKRSANPGSLRRAVTSAVEKVGRRSALAARQKEIEDTLFASQARNEEIQGLQHTLSHELKTPLTAVREFASILLDGLQGEVNAEQRESLERARSCCDRMGLLLDDTQAEARARPQRPPHARAASLGKRILAVEDDPDINRVLRIRLQAAGYEVVQAEDGLQGLLACVRHAPDLLLLDVSLPGGDGFSVIERLRADHPEFGRLPFIMLTASRRPDLRARASALGAAAFIEKPFDAGELLAAIGDALAPPAVLR